MLSVFALILAAPLFAQAPQVIEAPVEHLFIPAGFDNNDNVELVVTGHFPNPCYGRNDVTVDVRGDVVDVKVTSLVRGDEKSAACAAMIVPFKEVIPVGNLQGGDYKVQVNASTRFEIKENLKIEEAASQNQDDHIYALVDYIELGFLGGESGSAMLVGWKPSDCLELDRVEYVKNGKDTVTILPIMKKVSEFCPMKMTPLSIPVAFNPGEFSYEKILLMSRTIEGKSVNALVEKR
ncbi:MAG: hypothetical protein K2P81_10245 [Bacteriovoracaceae bacterium]|nr:hypothetical protein [Bacteriovoracaceae bacterium]